jgi:hypothetical protein
MSNSSIYAGRHRARGNALLAPDDKPAEEQHVGEHGEWSPETAMTRPQTMPNTIISTAAWKLKEAAFIIIFSNIHSILRIRDAIRPKRGKHKRPPVQL